MMKQVCLVSWDDLDEISEIDNSLTNSNKNYKEYDRMVVDIVMEFIQSKERGN